MVREFNEKKKKNMQQADSQKRNHNIYTNRKLLNIHKYIK